MGKRRWHEWLPAAVLAAILLQSITAGQIYQQEQIWFPLSRNVFKQRQKADGISVRCRKNKKYRKRKNTEKTKIQRKQKNEYRKGEVLRSQGRNAL